MKGRVKWFNNSKGYGFIVSDDDGDDEPYFVHYSSIQKGGYQTLNAGETVFFNVVQGPKGPHAVDIVSESPDEPLA